MKKMKKILAMLLALTMVLGMGLTSMAEGVTPSAIDSETVTIENVEVGATLNAYQLIDAEYTTEGFVKYVWAVDYEAGNIEVGDDVEFTTVTENGVEKDVVVGLTSDMITYVSKTIDATPVTKVASAETETMTLEVGTWMILVIPAVNATKIYNPMVASVYYNVTGSGDFAEKTGTTVDASMDWELVTTGAYAKSSELEITKVVDDKETAVGDVVNYTVTTTIPSYSGEYEEVTFKIVDTIINGLTYITDTDDIPVVNVKVGGSNVTAGDDTYSVTPGTNTDGKSNVTIEFNSSYILGFAAVEEADREVEITYSATITDAAINSVGENEVVLEYTHKPDGTTDAKEATAKVYTFEVDGVLTKVDENDDPLGGATFTMYKEVTADTEDAVELTLSNNETVYGLALETTCTTDTTGNIHFHGLDADYTYYLKETVAPTGYSLNEKVYVITFEVTYDDNEELVSYKVLVDGVASGAITYGGAASAVVATIVNTTLNALPSTGGIGTTIFTVAGCGIMIAAAFFFFASRKKENE